MVSVPWLLHDLQKIINDYLTGHQLYNKVVSEYKTKIHCNEFNNACKLYWVIANYRNFAVINTYGNRNIYNFSRLLKATYDLYLGSKAVLPINY